MLKCWGLTFALIFENHMASTTWLGCTDVRILRSQSTNETLNIVKLLQVTLNSCSYLQHGLKNFSCLWGSILIEDKQSIAFLPSPWPQQPAHGEISSGTCLALDTSLFMLCCWITPEVLMFALLTLITHSLPLLITSVASSLVCRFGISPVYL